MKYDTLNIEIDDELLVKLQVYLPKSGLKTVEELILSIIQNHLDENHPEAETEALDEEAEIQKRLKNLGYL